MNRLIDLLIKPEFGIKKSTKIEYNKYFNNLFHLNNRPHVIEMILSNEMFGYQGAKITLLRGFGLSRFGFNKVLHSYRHAPAR